MTTPLRIALVGAGWMGRQHAELIARCADTELAAVCDPFDTSLAQAMGVPHAESLDALLATGKFDAAIVSSPSDQHVQATIQLIGAGVPVLVEKPVGTSVTDARELIDTVERSSVPVLVGHHRRHHPQVRAAREYIDSGALGRIVSVTVLAQVKKPDDYFTVPWRTQPGSGGLLLINLIHDFDLVRHLVGEVARVSALVSNGTRQLAVEDSVAAILRFENGALGSLSASDSTAAPWSWEQSSGETAFAFQPSEPCLLIAGTEGALSIPQLAAWHYRGDAGWASPLSKEFVQPGLGEARMNQLVHFVDVVRGDAVSAVTVKDATRSLALLEAVSEAAANGCQVAPAGIG